MAHAERKLSATQVKNAKKPGFYSDGGGLYLQVTPGGTKSWVYRYTRGKKRNKAGEMVPNTRDMGLGAYKEASKKGADDIDAAAGLTLAEARDERDRHRDVLKKQRRDPIDARNETRAEADAEKRKADEAKRIEEQGRMTFAQAVGKYKALPNYGMRVKKGQVIGPLNAKHLYQIERAMDVASAGFGDTDVLDITKEDVKRVLTGVWHKAPVTAIRMRSVLEAVLELEEISDRRKGTNPASATALASWLRTYSRPAETSHPSLPWREMPAFMAALRECKGNAARALELAILCGSRQLEVRAARAFEIDLEAREFRLSADRMKARSAHVVPLSSAAVELLKAQRPRPGDFVFPGDHGGLMNGMAMGRVIKDMHAREVKAGRKGWIDPEQGNAPITMHGFRATLANFGADYAMVEDEVVEVSLAHATGTDVSRRYKRTNMLERRRAFLELWASYCYGEETENNVVPIREALA